MLGTNAREDIKTKADPSDGGKQWWKHRFNNLLISQYIAVAIVASINDATHAIKPRPAKRDSSITMYPFM